MPELYSGRQTVTVAITETVHSVQYDQSEIKNELSIVGVVHVDAELESVAELSVLVSRDSLIANLHSWSYLGNCTLVGYAPLANELISSYLMVHLFIRSDDEGVEPTVRFTPQIGRIEMCRYRVTRKHAPIRGFYQMKCEGSEVKTALFIISFTKALTETKVRLLVQLRLEADVNNILDFARVVIPFKCAARIAEFNASPTTGDVVLSEDGCSLLWEIGAHSRHFYSFIPSPKNTITLLIFVLY